MCDVKYIEKNFKKTSREEKEVIKKGMQKLIHKIHLYETNGISFEQIFNDDSVKYDILPKSFFIVKVQTQRIPTRVLYRFIRINSDNAYIEVHKSYLKKHTDPQKYIGIFENYVANY